MPDSFDDLSYKLSKVKGIAKKVQIDIMDGLYVPSQSWPYVGDEEDNFTAISSGEAGLPFWENFDFYIDLMIKNPEKAVANWMNAGASGIIIHAGSVSGDLVKIVKEIKYNYSEYIDLGVAFGSQETISNLEEILPNVDFVQCMGIKNIGYQGEDFDPNVLEQIKIIRSTDAEIPIMVDGSVNEETMKSLVNLGVDRLVIGSALFNSEDIKEKYKEFSEIANV